MLTCPKLSNITGIKHGFFTRQGGVSEGIYTSLNCGPGSNDNPDNVQHNRITAMNMLDSENIPLYTLYQTHSNNVVVLDEGTEYEPNTKADALVTNQPGIALGILTADCAPVLFVDSTSGVIAAAHAGWKGALIGILENTVAAMYDLGVQHHNITAVIGPCIGPNSYEVDTSFQETFLMDAPENHIFFTTLPKPNHALFDLPGYVSERLKRLGLASVEWLKNDTFANKESFFSYRRATLNNESDYGRQISIILKC